METRYLAYFNNMYLDQGDFFFSYYWDLTTIMQNQIPLKNFQINDTKLKSDLKKKTESNLLIPPLEEEKVTLKLNDRFVWNTHILQPLLQATENIGLIIPIINGSVCQRNIQLDGRTISLMIISRRSRFYAGPRYLKRGINIFGDVANEVETEQILFEGNPFDENLFKISSFLHVIHKTFITSKILIFFTSIEARYLFFGAMKIYTHPNLQLWYMRMLTLILKQQINILRI